MNTPELETPRLRLRRFTQKDIPALYTIFSDIEVNTYLPWYPLTSTQEAKTFFEKNYALAYTKPKGYKYAISLKCDDIPIGYIHVSTQDSHDLGYGLRKEFWHQGIVTEAARAVLKQVKKAGMPFVTATYDVNNPRSGHVMQALGMRYQYSYEEFWQPKNFLVTFRMYQINLDGDEKRVYRGYWNQYPNHFIENAPISNDEKLLG